MVLQAAVACRARRSSRAGSIGCASIFFPPRFLISAARPYGFSYSIVAAMDRIPFTLPDDSLREITGFVHFDGEFVVIDVRSKLIGLLDEQRNVIKVALSALESVRLKGGLFRDKFIVRPRSFELLEAVPGEHDREVALRTKRRHRDRVEDLVDDVAHHLRSAAV